MNASIWENALFSFLCQRLWSGETVRKVTLVENSAYYDDSNDDDDDHVEAGGFQAYKRQAGREGTRRKDYTEAFQFGEQVCHRVFKIICYGYE